MTVTVEFVADEAAMLAYGEALATRLAHDELVFLSGALGMGKTTLARGILRGLGHKGAVKSPTYTLIEPYDVHGIRIYHFDFYRIESPEELEYLGLDELLGEHAIKLVEWPERAHGWLPAPNRVIRIDRQRDGRIIEHEEFAAGHAGARNRVDGPGGDAG
jgi:tRNA threonylcarbamoyladenosine biosynthesis protein TsaE